MTTFNGENIHSVEFNLLDGQVELVLRALESYASNLEFILKSSDLPQEIQEDKLASLRCTYEQIIATQAEQVESKRDNLNHLKELGEKLIFQFRVPTSESKELILEKVAN